MPPSFNNLLVLTPDAFGGRGGIALYNRDVLTALAAFDGIERITVLPRQVPDTPTEVPTNIDFRAAAAGGKLRFVWHFFKAARKPCDAVFCMHINLLPLAQRAARKHGVPLILWIYGIDAWQAPTKPSVQRALAHVDHVISISQVTLDKFRGWSQTPAERCVIMPNAIHVNRYGPGPAPDALLQRYGLHDRTVLMTLGRLSAAEQYKGFDQILDALPTLAAETPNIAYLVVGDGTDRARLEAKANTMGLADRVRFAGFIPEAEKADHYRLAHAYVMPSQGEGFGFVFLEALACGIPVVASDLDGGREAVREGQLGDLVDPREPDSVLRGIRSALSRKRGVVPEGLAHFHFAAFQDRLHTWLRGLTVRA